MAASTQAIGLAWALLLLASSPAQAQSQALGKSQSKPRVHTSLVEFDACLPLADGRVLAGSAGGLVVIDGNDRMQRVFTQLDDLPGTRIHSLRASSEGVWVGGEAGAALITLRGSALQVKRRIDTSPVRGMWIDERLAGADERPAGEKDIYLATWGQGLLRVHGDAISSVTGADAARPLSQPTLPPATSNAATARVTSVAMHDGALWWTTAGAGLWMQAAGAPVRRDESFSDDAVLWSLSADDTALWVAGEEGLGQAGRGLLASSMHSLRGSANVGGERVAVSFGAGARAWRDAHVDLPELRFVRSIASAQGVSCIGTQDELWIRRKGSWDRAQLQSGAPANDIAALVSDGTRTYLGGFDKGVSVLQGDRFVPVDIDIDPHVNALAIDSQDGALWIATSTGLFRYRESSIDRFTKRSGLPSRHVMSLAALPEGGVLAGTAAGAAIVSGKEIETIGGGHLVTGNVWAVARSADGANWLGTTRGLYRVRGTEVQHLGVVSGELSDDWVMALAIAKDGVFVGTYKGGVVRLRSDGKRIRATALGAGWINPGGLHWDGSILRAATMHGALQGNGVDADWHDLEPGPGIDTTAYLPDGEGATWVATRRGLARYAPSTQP